MFAASLNGSGPPDSPPLAEGGDPPSEASDDGYSPQDPQQDVYYEEEEIIEDNEYENDPPEEYDEEEILEEEYDEVVVEDDEADASLASDDGASTDGIDTNEVEPLHRQEEELDRAIAAERDLQEQQAAEAEALAAAAMAEAEIAEREAQEVLIKAQEKKEAAYHYSQVAEERKSARYLSFSSDEMSIREDATRRDEESRSGAGEAVAGTMVAVTAATIEQSESVDPPDVTEVAQSTRAAATLPDPESNGETPVVAAASIMVSEEPEIAVASAVHVQDGAEDEESEGNGPFYDERWGEYYYDDRGEPYYINDKGQVKFFYDETTQGEENNEDVTAVVGEARDESSARSAPVSDVEEEHSDNDVEMAQDDDDSSDVDKPRDSSTKDGRRFRSLEIFCCIAMFALIITLPIVLTRSDDDDRSIMVPTVAPTTLDPAPPPPSVSPAPTVTVPPTLSPTHGSFQLVSGPFIVTNTVSLSVSLETMVVGSPSFLPGAVQTFRKNNNGVFESFNVIFPPDDVIGPQESQGTGFGTSVVAGKVIGQDFVLIGAPNVVNSDFGSVAFGSAYYYVRLGSQWRQLSGHIYPPAFGVAEASGRFGAAVASAGTSRRIAVGAPDTNDATTGLAKSGAVYVYDFVNSAWSFSAKLEGLLAGGQAGSSVDMSVDGHYVVVGAPSTSSGYVLLYQNFGSIWSNVLLAEGQANGDEFGASVAFLTSDGSTVAVGAPGGANGTGYVRIFERASNGDYVPVTPDILGASVAESIGGSGTIAGGGGKLYVGASNGFVKEYAHNGSLWFLVREIDAGASLSSVDVDTSGVGVGANVEGDSIVVYE